MNTITSRHQLREALTHADLACTPQRLAIFEVLAEARSHPSAEEVYLAVRTSMPTISRDTVYRTLALFEELGLLDRVQMSSECARFEPNLTPHHHVVCTRCGVVADFDWTEVNELPRPPLPEGWNTPSRPHVLYRGTCPACKNNSQTTKSNTIEGADHDPD